MIESPFNRIVRKTGRKPCSCKCEKCRMQCHTPCLGTPQDILKLVEAGYADRLALTDWAAGMIMGVAGAPIPMIQALRDGDYCTFYHDGLCELHDKGLKPTEGKLSHHSTKIETFSPKKSLSWNVAKEWFNPENKAVVVRLFKLWSDEIKKRKSDNTRVAE